MQNLLDKKLSKLKAGIAEDEEDSESAVTKIVADPLTKLENRLEMLKKLKVKGNEKFPLEMDACLKIPTDKRVMILNHHFNEDGEGEPHNSGEVIRADGPIIYSESPDHFW